MRRASICLSILLLTACSDDSGSSRADIGATDAAPRSDSAPKSDGAPGRDGSPGADGASATDGAPAGEGGVAADASAGPAPQNDTCQGALPLKLANGVATASGNTTSATDALKLASGCVTSPSAPSLSFTTPGQDVFFSVQLVSGKTYNLDLDGASGSPKFTNCALYVFSSCSDPEGTCLAGQSSDSSIWPVASLKLTPKSSGTHYIGVDSVGTQKGAFELTIKEL